MFLHTYIGLMSRAKENTKSGLLAALAAGVVDFGQFFGGDLGFNLDALREPDNLMRLWEGVKVWGIAVWAILTAGGGVVLREQLAPKQLPEIPVNTEVVKQWHYPPQQPSAPSPEQRPDLWTQVTPLTESEYQEHVLNGGAIDASRRYTWFWGKRSKERQKGVESAIVELVTEALSICPFDVAIAHQGGLRDIVEQFELYLQGDKTELLNSRHLHGLALDIVMYMANGKHTFDLRYYNVFYRCMLIASKRLNIGFRWGGHWDSVDAVHFELLKSEFPDNPTILAQLTKFKQADAQLA